MFGFEGTNLYVRVVTATLFLAFSYFLSQLIGIRPQTIRGNAHQILIEVENSSVKEIVTDVDLISTSKEDDGKSTDIGGIDLSI